MLFFLEIERANRLPMESSCRSQNDDLVCTWQSEVLGVHLFQRDL